MNKTENHILEAGILTIREGQAQEFEETFATAQKIIMGSPGYISHELRRCLEIENQYLLLIRWESLEDHTIKFRGSEAFQQWRTLLHHFYEPMPQMLHYENTSTIESSNKNL